MQWSFVRLVLIESTQKGIQFKVQVLTVFKMQYVTGRTITPIDIPVYNYVSNVENPLRWADFLDIIFAYKSIWLYFYVKNRTLYTITSFFLNWIPALILDTFFFFTGRKPR